MIVLLSGMPRSGSTWSYNACRAILEAANIPIEDRSGVFGSSEAIAERLREIPDPDGALMLKCHFPGEAGISATARGAARNIYTHRDPRSAVASLRRTFGTSFKNSVRFVQRSLYVYQALKGDGETLFVGLDDIVTAPEREVERVAEYLRVPGELIEPSVIAAAISRDKLRDQARKQDSERLEYIDGIGHDPATGLTTDHIPHEETSDWRRHLSPRERRLCDSAWGALLVDLGYETSEPAGSPFLERAIGLARLRLGQQKYL